MTKITSTKTNITPEQIIPKKEQIPGGTLRGRTLSKGHEVTTQNESIKTLRGMLFDKMTILESRKSFLKGQGEGAALLIQKNKNTFIILVNTGEKDKSISKISVKILRNGKLKVGKKTFNTLDKLLQAKGIQEEKILKRGNDSEEARIRNRAERDLRDKESGSVLEYSRRRGKDQRWQEQTWLAVKKNGVITLHKVEHSRDKIKGNLERIPSPKSRFTIKGGEREMKGLVSDSEEKLLRGKMIDPNTKIGEMERRLIKLFNKSPHLLTPIIYEKEGKDYLVIERKSSDLEKLFQGEGKSLTSKQTTELFRKILSGVKEMHDHQTVHFDLKLANVLINYNKENPEASDVHLIDFGETHIFDDPDTSLAKKGTPGYFDPQFALWGTENIDQAKAVDIYGLGIMLISMHAKQEFSKIELEEGKGFKVGDREFTNLSEILGRIAAGPIMGLKNPPPIETVLTHFLGGDKADPQNEISPETIQLIARMLNGSIENRPTIDQVITEVDRLIIQQDDQNAG